MATDAPWWQASQDGMDYLEVAAFEDAMTQAEYAAYRAWQDGATPKPEGTPA